MRVPIRLLWNEWPPNTGVMPGDPHFDAVFASIARDGIREPIDIGLDWHIIDGRHRYESACILGIETVEVRVWTGKDFVS